MLRLLLIKLHAEFKMSDSAFFSAAAVAGHLMRLSMRCQVENAVHMGEPISNCGLSSFAFRIALSLMTLLSKSHRAPPTSAVVRPRQKHGISPTSGNSLVAAVILGGKMHL